jgi:protein arginine kinase activator
MLCQKCQKRPATVFLSQTVGDQTSQFHLCEECAKEQGAIYGGMNMMNFNPLAALSDILNSVMGMDENPLNAINQGRSAAPDSDIQLQCPHCGYQLSVFRKTGRLGCTQCYQSFRAALEPVITGIHGPVYHAEETLSRDDEGETQKQDEHSKSEISLLRKKIKEAIKHERFEEAAQLRDQIKTIEEK